jgi:inosine/xanthosine triphosphate pyrophosphatase family protein
MLINSISDFRRAVRNGPYAWPGGYPLYFITSDGAALSFKAAKAERRNILEALRDNDTRSGWHVCAVDVNWEDTELTCDHTGDRIESAYGND